MKTLFLAPLISSQIIFTPPYARQSDDASSSNNERSDGPLTANSHESQSTPETDALADSKNVNFTSEVQKILSDHQHDKNNLQAKGWDLDPIEEILSCTKKRGRPKLAILSSEILKLKTEKLTNKQIAEAFNTTERQIYRILKRIKQGEK